MRTVDLTPLYRSIVGVDRMIDMIDAATRADSGSPGYPPFNIEETDENAYRIELAVAGFAEDDLTIEVNEGTLTVTGRKEQAEGRKFLHRGIAERAFERRFKLADHVIVEGAKLDHGMLTINLRRELPEAMKPRQIAITNGASKTRATTKKVIDASADD
jgi:molecular chaperone IbpA